MKISEIITEATGPERIKTGNSSSIVNPAYTNLVYEGDPDNYDFGKQTKNYTIIKNALARSGKKFNYIGVGKSNNGLISFVATAPGLVWYKYEGNTPGSGQNFIYVGGSKIRTTAFISYSEKVQDNILNKTNSPLGKIDLILTHQGKVMALSTLNVGNI